MEHGRFNHKHLGRFLESFSIKWLMIVVAIYVGMDYAQAMPQNIDKLIEIYETKGCRVDDANKIFDFLNKEEITGQRRNSVAELSEDDRQTVHEEWQI